MPTLKCVIDGDRATVQQIIEGCMTPIDHQGLDVKLGHLSENGCHVEITGNIKDLTKLREQLDVKMIVSSIR